VPAGRYIGWHIRLEAALQLVKWLRTFAATVAAIVVGVAKVATRRVESSAVELKPGDKAPDFSLPGSDGRTYRLNDLAGRPVVIAWFPKAFTVG
jgi:cytochrome oxidase Cu insertion factor (SCO1/SenC/PrrC family)